MACKDGGSIEEFGLFVRYGVATTGFIFTHQKFFSSFLPMSEERQLPKHTA